MSKKVAEEFSEFLEDRKYDAEWWISQGELEQLNDHTVGEIEDINEIT